MEALYKMKKPKTGQANRIMRAKLKDTASKTSRANLLDSKRRIPLSEVQPSTNKNPGEPVATTDKKSTLNRVERLQEWKKQREEAKAKQREQGKKNPPFRPCGSKKITLLSTGTTQPSAAKSVPAVKNSTISVSSKPPDAMPKKTTKKTTAPPQRSSARLAAKHQAAASTVPDSIKTRATRAQQAASRSGKNPSTQASTKPQTRTQEAATSKKSGVPSAAKPQATRARQSQNAISDIKRSTKTIAPVNRKKPLKNVSEKHTTRSTAPKTTSTKTSDPKKSSVSKSQKNKNTRNKETEDRGTVVEMENNDPATPPTTPKHSYVPVHPSPLLMSQVAPLRKVTVYVPGLTVNDPAWIPGAVQDMDSTANVPNFDEAFKTTSFSPFRFTAVQYAVSHSPSPQQQQFVFKPVSSLHHADSGVSRIIVEKRSTDAEPNRELETSLPARKHRRSSRRCSRRLEMVDRLSSSEDDESGSNNTEGTQLAEGQEEEPVNGCENAVDIAYFHGLHARVTENFTQLCCEWEEKSNKLEQKYGSDNNCEEGINMEDVLGQIRTTVCQAQLLMRKKLKQYMNLVDQAQDPNVEKRANADDLQSFWDMVYFQVEDVQKKFDAIGMLEKNGWKDKAPTPAKKKTKKRQAGAKKMGSSSSEANERLQAARDKREAQRNRLKEMKLAAKRAREQESKAVEEPEPAGEEMQAKEEPLPVTPSPKRSKLARTPKIVSPSKERRCSPRLKSRSVFSPIEPSRPVNCINEIPTGRLISLTPLK